MTVVNVHQTMFLSTIGIITVCLSLFCEHEASRCPIQYDCALTPWFGWSKCSCNVQSRMRTKGICCRENELFILHCLTRCNVSQSETLQTESCPLDPLCSTAKKKIASSTRFMGRSATTWATTPNQKGMSKGKTLKTYDPVAFVLPGAKKKIASSTRFMGRSATTWATTPNQKGMSKGKTLKTYDPVAFVLPGGVFTIVIVCGVVLVITAICCTCCYFLVVAYRKYRSKRGKVAHMGHNDDEEYKLPSVS